jgi:hypothetical protein
MPWFHLLCLTFACTRRRQIVGSGLACGHAASLFAVLAVWVAAAAASGDLSAANLLRVQAARVIVHAKLCLVAVPHTSSEPRQN